MDDRQELLDELIDEGMEKVVRPLCAFRERIEAMIESDQLEPNERMYIYNMLAAIPFGSDADIESARVAKECHRRKHHGPQTARSVAEDVCRNTFQDQQQMLYRVFINHVSYETPHSFGTGPSGIEAMLMHAEGRIDGWFNGERVDFVLPRHMGRNEEPRRFSIVAEDFGAANLTIARRDSSYCKGLAGE